MTMNLHPLKAFLFAGVVAAAPMAGATEQQAAHAAPSSKTSTPAPSQAGRAATANRSIIEWDKRARLFQQSKQCLELSLAAEGLSNAVQVCLAEPAGSAGRDSCEKRTRGYDIQSYALATQASNAGCGSNAQALHRNFAYATVQAARVGNPDAQMCFFEWVGPLSSVEDVSRYKQEAMGYMQKALARGDWRVVQLLSTSPEGVANGSVGLMADLDVAGNWSTAYRANRLLLLGATGTYKTTVEANAATAKEHLTTAQADSADAWALQEYKRHFASRPTLSEAPTPCLHPASLIP